MPAERAQATLISPASVIERVRDALRVPLARAAAWVGEQPNPADALVILTRSETVRVPAALAEQPVLVLQVPGEWPVGLLLELACDVRVMVDHGDTDTGHREASPIWERGTAVEQAAQILDALGWPKGQLSELPVVSAEPDDNAATQRRRGAEAECMQGALHLSAHTGESVPLGRRLLLRPFLRRRGRALESEPAGDAGVGPGTAASSTGRASTSAVQARAAGGRVGLTMPADEADQAGRKLWAEALIDDMAAEQCSGGDSVAANSGRGARTRAEQQRALLAVPRPGRSLIASGCAGSGTCVSVCPMGALERPRAGDHFSLLLDAAACVECGLCVEHCPEDALSLRDGAAWGDALGVTLAVGALKDCRRCGMAHGRPGELCAVCAFRRENPTGMWLPPGFVRKRDRG